MNRELLTGPPLDVEEKVKENILNLGIEGRYMIEPICSLPWRVPLPNIFALINARDKYGIYQIKK